ncbi:hypothetical protein pb186bvf_007139 [Paramecium bursaria]
MKNKKLKYNQLNLNKFHQLQRKKKPNQVGESQKITTNCSAIKKKVRDIERQISSGKLPENILEIQKEKLNQLQLQLVEKQKEIKDHEKTERYFTIKYGKIKSFELKKLSRKLKQILKQLSTASEEVRQIIKLEEDKVLDLISYIKNYPKDKKYISIFGKSNNEHAQQIQQDLIEVNKQKNINKETKKYRVKQDYEEKATEDDFFADQEMIRQRKTMVDKQGKIIEQINLFN